MDFATRRPLTLAALLSVAIHAGALGIVLAGADPSAPDLTSMAVEVAWLPSDESLEGANATPPVAAASHESVAESAAPATVDQRSASKQRMPDRAKRHGAPQETPPAAAASKPSSIAAQAPAIPPDGAGSSGHDTSAAANGTLAGSADPATTLAGGAPAAASNAGPDVVHRVAPIYPVAARRRGAEGSVLLRVQIDESGWPVHISVVTSAGSELLDDAARAAILRWRFRAGAAGTLDVPIAFRLRDATDRLQTSDAGLAKDK